MQHLKDLQDLKFKAQLDAPINILSFSKVKQLLIETRKYSKVGYFCCFFEV